MAYLSPTQIERQRALSQQLRAAPQERSRGGVGGVLSGLAHVLRQYGAGVGEHNANVAETGNQTAQTKDLQQLVNLLRTGGMTESNVTGMEGQNLGTIPAKRTSFETPEVNQMYVQALMKQQDDNRVMTPEQEAQKIRLNGGNQSEYGLTPNLYQKDGKWFERIYNKGGQFTDREMPGEPVRGMSFNPTLQGEIAGTKQQEVKDVDLTMNPQIEQASESAKVIGKTGAEKQVELKERLSQLPRLEQIASELSELGKKATYTETGKAVDSTKRQLGMEVGEGAVARKEYISKVDNEILPLLRQTFGAAFTQKEGDSLKNTLGDPDASPEEKDAVLRSFIATKRAQIEGLSQQTDIPDQQDKLFNSPPSELLEVDW